jgi:hypothetical protein
MIRRRDRSMARKFKTLPGPVSMFRGKVRKPVSLTLTPAHHAKVDAAVRRLGVTRADLIGLLVERYADTVTAESSDYQRLIEAIGALGGRLEFDRWNGPQGAAWLLVLGKKRLRFLRPYAALEACFGTHGAGSGSNESGVKREIDASGVAELFRLVVSTEDAAEATEAKVGDV